MVSGHVPGTNVQPWGRREKRNLVMQIQFASVRKQEVLLVVTFCAGRASLVSVPMKHFQTMCYKER